MQKNKSPKASLLRGLYSAQGRYSFTVISVLQDYASAAGASAPSATTSKATFAVTSLCSLTKAT